MTTSPVGRAFIRDHEGCKLTAYQDGGGTWTVGTGHVPAHQGQTITQEEADALLTADLRTAENCINAAVVVPLNQNQFDSLVSFVFNVGCGAFRGSTMCRLLNLGEYARAANELPRWNLIAGEPSAGLTNRRRDEQKLFLTPVAQV